MGACRGFLFTCPITVSGIWSLEDAAFQHTRRSNLNLQLSNTVFQHFLLNYSVYPVLLSFCHKTKRVTSKKQSLFSKLNRNEVSHKQSWGSCCSLGISTRFYHHRANTLAPCTLPISPSLRGRSRLRATTGQPSSIRRELLCRSPARDLEAEALGAPVSPPRPPCLPRQGCACCGQLSGLNACQLARHYRGVDRRTAPITAELALRPCSSPSGLISSYCRFLKNCGI